MTPSEYLDAAKVRLCLSSDYEFCKKLDIPRGHMPAMRRGERAIPPHLALSLALTLELDPAQVIFDLESQREKNEKRREMYRSFISRARSLAILVCTLGLTLSAGLGNDQAGHGGRFRRSARFA